MKDSAKILRTGWTTSQQCDAKAKHEKSIYDALHESRSESDLSKAVKSEKLLRLERLAG